jgi:ATP-dependent Clp protease ATP-binding subunit ClpC
MPDDSYENALAEARNWVALARSGEIARIEFRAKEVAAVVELLERHRSVLLVGPSGVGKSAVLAGVAHELTKKKKRGLAEVSTVGVLAGTRYLGEWQTKITRLVEAAHKAHTALLFSDIWNLGVAGRTAQNSTNMLDALRPHVDAGKVALVGEATPELFKLMQRVPGFVEIFEVVEVAPMPEAEVKETLMRAAERRGVTLDPASLRSLLGVTGRFSPARPQPGPALKLARELFDYRERKRAVGDLEPVSPALVEKVFSITSGLPLFVVSREATLPPAEIRAWFTERIVGQRAAIESVIETIALFKAGLHDPNKPIGTFLFVGPTGVGKTELARALATFLFGTPQRLLRFDLSELKDYSSFELLVGNPQAPDKPARLLDPVRAQPFQVVLFDELEKAHPNIWDVLLPLLDEGRMTTPWGETLSFASTILIATSNVGATEAAHTVGFGTGDAHEAREGKIRMALERQFRPEFINRFQHLTMFHPLSAAELRSIAQKEVGRLLAREGIAAHDLVVDVDDEALDLVIESGVDTRYGARSLKREVQRRIALPLAMTLMEQRVASASILKVMAKDGEVRVRVVETEASRAARRDAEPPRAPDGRVVTLADLSRRLDEAKGRIDALAKAVDREGLRTAKQRWSERKKTQEFWKNVTLADEAHHELERIEVTLDRLERLELRRDGFRDALGRASGRAVLEKLAWQLRDFEEAVSDAHRELAVLGWEGSYDALVEVRPVGGSGREARDRLAALYEGWAAHRQLVVHRLREPRADDEPLLLAIKGLYAFGMLRGESGLHRFRVGGPGSSPPSGSSKISVAAVRVAAHKPEKAALAIAVERPLKGVGQLGGKVRSRLECTPLANPSAPVLVLQNAGSLADNRELAADLAASWASAPVPKDVVVRRYDLEPPLVRDELLDWSSGRRDALAPAAFDALLKKRADAAVVDVPVPNPAAPIPASL